MNIVRLDPGGHRRTQAQFARYLTGRLDDAARAEVDTHLAGCPRCRAELDAERHLHGPATAPARPARAWWRWAMATQAAAVLVLAGVVAWQARHVPAYQALGEAAAPPAAADAIVMFRPGATEAQMRKALTATGAHVVGGPTASGAWLLALPDDQALAPLRAQPGVSMAESLRAAP